MLTHAKQINGLFSHFGERISDEDIKVIFTTLGVELDLRNLAPRLIVQSIESSLQKGMIRGLCAVSFSL
jgi:hypothetical protein